MNRSADATPSPAPPTCLTIDVEEWFHLLDSAATPPRRQWDDLPERLERNLDVLLSTLAEYDRPATLFWLGWVARKYPHLLRACVRAGHEIASHGMDHLLAFRVGPEVFRRDIVDAKHLLEDLAGEAVEGFRAPGFGITAESPWALEVIREAGYAYDASIFPATRGHGGIRDASLAPHVVDTPSGALTELPMSMATMAGRRLCLFSGGYLRLAPAALIRWGVRHVQAAQRPVIVLVHPREVDVHQPRLKLGYRRTFQSYVNLRTTLRKFAWFCRTQRCVRMKTLAAAVAEGRGQRPVPLAA